MTLRSQPAQRGFSLIGSMLSLAMLGLIGLLAVRVGPSVLEYWAIDKAVKAAKAVANTPTEVRVAFDRMADAGYIDTISGKDLVIEGTGNEMQVSFAYEKKIPLAGPASLLIDYRGTTAAAEKKLAENPADNKPAPQARQ